MGENRPRRCPEVCSVNMENHPDGVLPGLEGWEQDTRANGREVGGVVLATDRPVARVAIDTRVPHLDRLFDYSVPSHLSDTAEPGTRVRIKFHGRETVAWLIERCQQSDSHVSLQPLREVVSPVRALAPEIWELIQAVASRYAGLNSDVLRLAVPPRAVRPEKKFERDVLGLEPRKKTPHGSDEQKPNTHVSVPAEIPGPTWVPEGDDEVGHGWALYAGGTRMLEQLAEPSGDPVRRVVAVAPSASQDWAALMARACAATLSSGKRAVVVVPDNPALDRLESALNRLVDADKIARLSNGSGLMARYSSFLKALSGQAWVVIGTRSAAFAPVPDLGLLACFDDGDENLVERQAPYCNARDVLLLRAQLQECSAIFLGYAVTPEGERLVQTRWAQPVAPKRDDLRSHSPLIRATSDSFTRERDPMAALARIPHLAYQVAREALSHGPVLVQVARTGYAPSLACQRCRASARCPHCMGPLSLDKDSRSQAVCRWCHRGVSEWSCSECGHDQWRLTTVGALRTAEELGRAFPQVPVVNSSGENVKDSVSDQPALVVATPGAEPRAVGGYRAALLLDGDRMLARDSLRVSEQVLRRWMNACSLVTSRINGGQVICTAEDSSALAALVRWDPAGFAARELSERHDLGLPPAVRTAAITGPRIAVEEFVRALDLPTVGTPPALRLIDPVPTSDDDENDEYRAIIFMAYGIASRVTELLRGTRAVFSASRKYESVQIRCDALDVF